MAQGFVAAQEEGPTLEPSVEHYISTYAQRSVAPEVWEELRPSFVAILTRSKVTEANTLALHATALVAYLAWRHKEARSLEVDDAMVATEIEAFYLNGTSHLGTLTRNDYRSRLRTQAARLREGVLIPPLPRPGRRNVKPGYSEAEEAVIRRAALGQSRPEVRRRLCAVVGFGGGCGLSPEDLCQLRTKDVAVTEAGIVVSVQGPRARTVVVRRSYEPLIHAAILGCTEDQLLLSPGKDRSNPAARAVANAQLFDDVPHIEMRRLRSTWIAWLLRQALPLYVVLHVTGLRSARTLVDLAATIEDPIDAAVLRGDAR